MRNLWDLSISSTFKIHVNIKKFSSFNLQVYIFFGPSSSSPNLVELARRFVVTKRRGNLVELVLCACIDGWEVIVRS